jgi:TonB family protein
MALGLLMVALLLPAPRLRAQPPEFSVVAPLRLSQAARQTKAGPPAAAADPVYEIGTGVSAPVPLRQQDPTYPRAAMQAKIAGEVQLSGVVEANGLLDQIRITKSLDTVHGLDQAAIDAASKWIFKPGMKDGKSAPVRVQMVLEFRLRASPPANPAPQQAPPAAAQGADDDFAKNAYNDSTPGLVLPKPKSLRPDPAYSQEAMQQKIQGTVKIEAVVAADGTVDRARVVESLDKIYGLDEAAIAAARRWTFEPGTLNGQPVPVLVSLMMEFGCTEF